MPESTWSDEGNGEFVNSTGFRITRNGTLTMLISDDLELEDIIFEIPLEDIFNNPYVPVVFLDPDTGKIPQDMLPSIVLGNTYYVNSFLELTDPTKYRDHNGVLVGSPSVIRGDVVVVLGTSGGASFRLMGTDFSNIRSWAELVSRFANWSDIQAKPAEFPPEDHEHDFYPKMVMDSAGKYMIPSKFIPSIPLGKIITPLDETDLPVFETIGCWAMCQNGRIFVYNYRWIEIHFPTAGVRTVNGQSGVVNLDPEDIGAAEEDHTHEPPDIIMDDAGELIQFHQTYDGSDKVLLWKDQTGNLNPFFQLKDVNGRLIRIVQTDDGYGNQVLMWIDDQGAARPFA